MDVVQIPIAVGGIILFLDFKHVEPRFCMHNSLFNMVSNSTFSNNFS